MATTINAGRVAMVPKGAWSSSTAYERLDVVELNGSSYVAKQDNTNQNPATATTYWQLLASGASGGGGGDYYVCAVSVANDSVTALGYMHNGDAVTASAWRTALLDYVAAPTDNATFIAVDTTHGRFFSLAVKPGNTIGNPVRFVCVHDGTIRELTIKQADNDVVWDYMTYPIQEALVSGTNIKTINSTSLLGSGDVTVPAGKDGKSAYQSYLDTTTDVPPKTEAEWVASLKGEDGAPGAPGAPGADGVDLGEVALVQSNGMNAEKVMSQKAVTENYIELSDYYYQVIRKAYSTVKYTSGTLNNSGEVVSGLGYVTNFLPVVGGETLHVNITTTTKFAYYDVQSAFISIVTVGSGMRSYVVPANAVYARFQVVYNGGATPLLGIREKTFENKSFYDLIASPIKTTISIGFTGDSNTVGYGLASGEKSWANLLGDALVANFATKRYGFNSPWVESMGFSPYSGANFKTNSQMSIYTDAETITLGIIENYSAAWKWQIDGVDSGTASSNSLTTDGALHKITVVFTAGQSVNPYFVINKTITYANDALTGAGINNMPFNAGYDWYFVMIGTNNRGNATINNISQLMFKYGQQYFGKGTYVVPFPNHKSDSSYIYSQMLIYSQLAELFKEAGWDIINLAAINADAFYTDTNYQSDKIHYNATGHRIIANMVSGTLGFPLYLQG